MEAFRAQVSRISVLEAEAMHRDRRGEFRDACAKYREAAAELGYALSQLGTTYHPDAATLERHRGQLLDRAAYLEHPLGGAAARRPIEDHIQTVQLSMNSTNRGSVSSEEGGGGKVIAAAAGIGAVGGLILLGPIVGSSLGIVAGAAAVGYASTRDDKVGNVARSAASTASDGVMATKKFNDDHNISGKAVALGQNAWTRAKEVNEKHDITGKVERGAGKTVAAVKGVNEKFKITDKAGAMISSGLDKANAKLSRNSAPAASTGI